MNKFTMQIIKQLHRTSISSK